MVLPPPSNAPQRDDAVADRAVLQRPGALEFAGDRMPWQRSLRWRTDRRGERRWWRPVIALVALLVTIAELVAFDIGMRSPWKRAPLRARGGDVLVVDLIDPVSEAPPPPPEPEPPEFKPRASRVEIAAPKVDTRPPPKPREEASDAMAARIGRAGAPQPPPRPSIAPAAPQLFNPDGSIRLDGAARLSAPTAPANPQQAAKERWAEIEKRGDNPLDCRKTRFAAGYAPDESLGSGVARKYLSWAGLYDPHDTDKRARRAAEGCDPAGK